MSVMSEQPREQPPTDPNDPLHYAPRRLAERASERLPRSEPVVRPLSSQAPLSAKLESAVYESLRRQIEPEAVPEPADFKREQSRRLALSLVIGVAAAIVVVAVGIAVFVTMFSHNNGAGSFFAGVAPRAGTPPQPTTERGAALAQFRALLVPGEGGQTYSHEESERLLQQFVQWRQKSDAAGNPQ
jgi:hypothetical protein